MKFARLSRWMIDMLSEESRQEMLEVYNKNPKLWDELAQGPKCLNTGVAQIIRRLAGVE